MQLLGVGDEADADLRLLKAHITRKVLQHLRIGSKHGTRSRRNRRNSPNRSIQNIIAAAIDRFLVRGIPVYHLNGHDRDPRTLYGSKLTSNLLKSGFNVSEKNLVSAKLNLMFTLSHTRF